MAAMRHATLPPGAHARRSKTRFPNLKNSLRASITPQSVRARVWTLKKVAAAGTKDDGRLEGIVQGHDYTRRPPKSEHPAKPVQTLSSQSPLFDTTSTDMIYYKYTDAAFLAPIFVYNFICVKSILDHISFDGQGHAARPSSSPRQFDAIEGHGQTPIVLDRNTSGDKALGIDYRETCVRERLHRVAVAGVHQYLPRRESEGIGA